MRVMDDGPAREARVARALERVRGLAWEVESDRYLALVERLLGSSA